MADEVEQGTPAPQDPGQAAPAQVTGPWAKDLQDAFSDPQMQADVDAFMRSRVQPRMTQLEQQIAQSEQARQLWDAFQGDPGGTWVAIANELYGEEYANQLQSQLYGQEQAATQEPAPAQPLPPSTEDPFIAQLKAERQEAEEMRQYTEYKDWFLGQTNSAGEQMYADIQPHLFDAFVSASNGEWEQAVEMYRAHAAGMMGTPATEPQEGVAAPPVISGDSGGASGATPAAPQYRGQQGLNQALDDMMAESRRAREAPPVG